MLYFKVLDTVFSNLPSPHPITFKITSTQKTKNQTEIHFPMVIKLRPLEDLKYTKFNGTISINVFCEASSKNKML